MARFKTQLWRVGVDTNTMIRGHRTGPRGGGVPVHLKYRVPGADQVRWPLVACVHVRSWGVRACVRLRARASVRNFVNSPICLYVHNLCGGRSSVLLRTPCAPLWGVA